MSCGWSGGYLYIHLYPPPIGGGRRLVVRVLDGLTDVLEDG